MSVIIACYKWVADELDIRINGDFSVDTSKAKGKISDYDKNAIEAAVEVAQVLGAKPVGLTFGNQKARQSLKDALSRGLEEAYWVQTDTENSVDGVVTARSLAAALSRIGDYRLVICAEGASDSYARQTAPRIGALLDIPVITSVIKMEFQNNTLIAQRKLDDCIETVKVELPAVVAVLPEAYKPAIPGLKAVMAAGKKPVTEFRVQDLGIDLTPKVQTDALKGYVMNRKNTILSEGENADKVRDLIALLRKEGVL